MSFASVALLIVAVIAITVSFGLLNRYLWEYSSSHIQQPKYPLTINIFFLTLLPSSATLYLVYVFFVENSVFKKSDWPTASSVSMVFSFLISCFVMTMLVLAPICRFQRAHIYKLGPKYFILAFWLTLSTCLLRQAFWDGAYDFTWGPLSFLYENDVPFKVFETAPIVGWEPIGDPVYKDNGDGDDNNGNDGGGGGSYLYESAVISVQLSTSCTVQVETDCEMFDTRPTFWSRTYYPDTPDDDAVTYSFSCGAGPSPANVFPDATFVLGNSHACKAHWFSADATPYFVADDYLFRSENRYWYRAGYFAALSFLIWLWEFLYERRQQQQQQQHRLENSRDNTLPEDNTNGENPTEVQMVAIRQIV